MKVLLIIAAVVAFILLLKAKVIIDYREELRLSVAVLGIPIRILPAKQKRVRVGRYGLRKMRRREEKQRLTAKKRAVEAQRKAEEKAKKKAERKEAKKNAPKTPLTETLTMILAIVKVFFGRFGHHLHIDLTRLRLTVATGDAAKTAILWGAICPTVAAILEILDRVTNLKKEKNADIDVVADFVGESIKADICIAFSLRVWHLFDIAFRVLFTFLRHKSKSAQSSDAAIKTAIRQTADKTPAPTSRTN